MVVNVKGGGPDLSSGNEVAAYHGAGPPPGTGKGTFESIIVCYELSIAQNFVEFVKTCEKNELHLTLSTLCCFSFENKIMFFARSSPLCVLGVEAEPDPHS